jgi:hypothetical protein
MEIAHIASCQKNGWVRKIEKMIENISAPLVSFGGYTSIFCISSNFGSNYLIFSFYAMRPNVFQKNP